MVILVVEFSDLMPVDHVPDRVKDEEAEESYQCPNCGYNYKNFDSSLIDVVWLQ